MYFAKKTGTALYILDVMGIFIYNIYNIMIKHNVLGTSRLVFDFRSKNFYKFKIPLKFMVFKVLNFVYDKSA